MTPELAATAWIFWTGIGLCLGSFVNVVIHRLPRNRSLVRPRSHCPRCRKTIRWYDNVPILSFALLRGACRHCGKTISWRYPLVEAIVGGVTLALWWRWPGQWIWVSFAVLAVAAFTAVAFIDLDRYIIPDELSLGLLVAGLAIAPANPLYSGTAMTRVAFAVGGGAVGFFLTLAIGVFGKLVFRKKGAMGFGDVKLMAGVGAWTGALGSWDCLILAAFAGALIGGAVQLKR
ncbi:prepilin peptidase, partial [Elusimicrobiota bacterium]